MSYKVNKIDNNKLSSNQYLVRRKHNNFDLELFMRNRFTTDGWSIADGADLIVTPLQYVMTECFVRLPDSHYCDHASTVEAIYAAIYSDFQGFIENGKQSWYDSVVKDGNIIIQMCSGPNSFHIMGIPNVISQSQYNFLVVFNESIKEIYESNRDYFDRYPMRFTLMHSFYNYYEDKNVNCIDGIVEMMKNRVVNVETKEEFILGTGITSLTEENKKEYSLKKVRKYY